MDQINPRSKATGGVPAIQRPAEVEPAPPARAATAVPPTPPSDTQRRAPIPSGDVIASRPSVIVGGPPKVVGGGGTAKPRPGARVGEPAATSGSKGKKPREGARPGLFGKDLISEKSLDEVILAYLSEDGEEK
jgi:hypothetical protein